MDLLQNDDGVWRALSHPTRRQILDHLFAGSLTTGSLVTALGMDRHVVMAHLAVLREADLVLTQKQGRQRLNHLNSVPLEQIHQRWVSPASGPWAAALIAVRDRTEAAAHHQLTAREGGIETQKDAHG